LVSPSETSTKRKVVQLSSVHPPDDIRVFVKECRTLAAAGYDVVYVVPTENGGIVDGVKIRAIQPRNGRLKRWLFTVREVFQAAIGERGDIYHFHDPELLPFMVLLKWVRPSTRVIYDTHEDMPSAIATVYWLPNWLRRPVSYGVRIVERIAVRFLDGVVAATPAIARNFPSSKTVIVQNFPMLAEFATDTKEFREDGLVNVIHTGRVSRARGGTEMIEAMGLIPDDENRVTLTIAGMIVPDSYQEELEAVSGWSKVTFVGWKSREEMRALLRASDIGLVLMHVEKNNVEAQPNKLFEYMAVGLPVIASDFPWWRKIISEANAGLLVDPAKPNEIANAIAWLAENPAESKTMGENGLRAVREKYNWEREAVVLTDFYSSLFPADNRIG
jgi:glycosyltransferase involved in cell wall biosynthesis